MSARLVKLRYTNRRFSLPCLTATKQVKDSLLYQISVYLACSQVRESIDRTNSILAGQKNCSRAAKFHAPLIAAPIASFHIVSHHTPDCE